MNRTLPFLQKSFVTKLTAVSIGIASALISNSPTVHAAYLTWDANANGTYGGDGPWASGTNNWAGATGEVGWADLTGATDTAVFTGAPGIVSIGDTVGAQALIFNAAGYTIQSGTLNLGTGGIDASNLPSGTVSISSPIILGGAQAWNVASGATLASSGAISGANSLTKSGAGTLTLNGLNTFSGPLTISFGVLSTASNTALGGAGGTAGAVTIDGGTLQYLNSAPLTNTHAITIGSNGGTINITGPATTGNNSRAIFGASTLVGTGALTVTGKGMLDTVASGDGVMVINGVNTYSGPITLKDGGYISYEVANALPSSVSITLGNQSGISVNNGKTLANAITVSSGAYAEISTNNWGSAGTSTYSGAITTNGNLVANLKQWYDSTIENVTISGVISGTGSLATAGGGNLTLSNGANSYSGGTTLNGGKITLNNASAIGSGTLTLNSGNFVANAANGTISNAINATGAAGFYVTQNFTTSGAISGSGTIDNSVSSGNASWNINGDLSKFQGTFKYLPGGTQNNVNMGGATDASMDMSQATIVLAGSGGGRNLSLGGSGPSGTFKIGDLNGTGALIANVSNLQVGEANHNNPVYSGTLSGYTALTKVGTGKWTLSGVSTYTGATTVSSGTLALSGAALLSNSPSVTVASGATFDVSALTSGSFVVASGKSMTVNGSVIGTVAVSGTIKGNATGSMGNLNVLAGGLLKVDQSDFNLGALSLRGNATFALTINTGATSSSKVTASSLLLDTANSVVLTISDVGGDAALADGTKFTILDYKSGTYNGGLLTYNSTVLSNGAGFSMGSNYFQINYTDSVNGDNTVTLTAVPEPGTWAMVISGLGLLSFWQRNRRRSA